MCICISAYVGPTFVTSWPIHLILMYPHVACYTPKCNRFRREHTLTAVTQEIMRFENQEANNIIVKRTINKQTHLLFLSARKRHLPTTAQAAIMSLQGGNYSCRITTVTVNYNTVCLHIKLYAAISSTYTQYWTYIYVPSQFVYTTISFITCYYYYIAMRTHISTYVHLLACNLPT